MPLTRSKKKKDSSEEETSAPEVPEVSESSGESSQAAASSDPSDSGESSQVLFSTDGSEPPEDKGPPPEEEGSGDKEGKDSSSNKSGQSGGQQKQHKHQHPQNRQKKKKGKYPQHQHQHQQKHGKHHQQKHKRKQRRKTPSDLEERRPLEVGSLPSCEALASMESLANVAEEAGVGEGDALALNELIPLDVVELRERIAELEPELELPHAPIREDLFDQLLHKRFEDKAPVRVIGVLEVMEEGFGLLLQEKDNYRIKSQSAFVPAASVKEYGLQTGHVVEGFLRPKMEESTCPVLVSVESVMGNPPEEASKTIPFTELTPYYPLKRMFLETKPDVEWDNVSMRVVDLVSPIGFGQRGLIVAPPRTGKTILQQGIARALRVNNPDAHLIILLVDERPEEVTDFRRQVPDSEVIASTFDENAESHVHAAEIVIEKARRMVEVGRHVVILLDSITRLARAYNTTMPNSGKILSGGVEATALQRPKRFFGSARNIEGGGSLTILGTALVDTGSKMDEVIFEEFKGTGNMELHLDRELVNKRIFPALDFEKSGTRKEELLYHPDELEKIYALRRSLKGVPPAEAMEMFIQRVKKTKNNPEFLMGLGR